MSIPEKQFLSKKNCIYEVICYPDGRISVERRAVAYLNQHYIYVIVPGNDELVQLCFASVHDPDDTETLLDDLFLAKRRDFETSSYFWDRPDTSDEYLKKVNKIYLQNQIKDTREKIAKAKQTCDAQCRTYEALVEKCERHLEELEEE